LGRNRRNTQMIGRFFFIGKVTCIIRLEPLLHRGAVAEELLVLRDQPQLLVLLELTLRPDGLSIFSFDHCLLLPGKYNQFM
jgi:hypothetical protein